MATLAHRAPESKGIRRKIWWTKRLLTQNCSLTLERSANLRSWLNWLTWSSTCRDFPLDQIRYFGHLFNWPIERRIPTFCTWPLIALGCLFTWPLFAFCHFKGQIYHNSTWPLFALGLHFQLASLWTWPTFDVLKLHLAYISTWQIIALGLYLLVPCFFWTKIFFWPNLVQKNFSVQKKGVAK